MRAARAWLVLAALTLPAKVLACPVCSPDRDDATTQAFFSMTIFMTLLPLTMFGAVLYWVMRRVRATDAAHDLAREMSRELSPTAEE